MQPDDENERVVMIRATKVPGIVGKRIRQVLLTLPAADHSCLNTSILSGDGLGLCLLVLRTRSRDRRSEASSGAGRWAC